MSPVIIAIEATAQTAGIIRVAGSQANKRLSKKVEKHEKIKVLAKSTLTVSYTHLTLPTIYSV